MQRYDLDGELIVRRRPFHERYEKRSERVYELVDDENAVTDEEDPEPEEGPNGIVGNDEGEEA